MSFKQVLSLFLLLSLFFSCKEEEKPAPEIPDPKAPSIRLSQLPGTHASLQATYFSHLVDSGFIGKITYIQGWGKATFKSINGASLKPALVATEGVELKESKGVYSNAPGNSQGIDFGSEVIWEVSKEANNPGINATVDFKVPEIGDLTTGDTINSAVPLQLSIDMANAFTSLGSVDSVNYFLKGKTGQFNKRTNTANAVEVSVAELTSLGKGKAYIQVEAFRIAIKDYNGYKVGFVNKGVFNKQVWIY